MALNTAKYVSAIRGLTRVFVTGLRKARPFYPQVATIVPSSGKDEGYGILGAIPQVRELLGERKFEELEAGDFTIKNRPFGVSLEVLRHDVDDDRYGGYRMKFREAGQRARLHPDELMMEVMNNAETTTCFDGKSLVATDHEWGDSGAQSNKLTYNVADVGNKPTATEFLDSYDLALEQFTTYKDDKGQFVIQPIIEEGFGQNFIVLVPPRLSVVAKQAFRAEFVGGGNTNVRIDPPQRVVTTPHLSSNVKWQLVYVGGVIRPVIFQARSPLQIDVQDVGNIKTKTIKVMTEARYNVGPGAWWNVVQTEFN